ncbi:hypothetical protein [uncultured Desulfovibrio sp.]|uniref:hypothetical protein n=1 Tax=uncultured Desulfovibrio sp. TaxID=167968 RepID=UPI0026060AE1|nr:hypothetical protein [uncultured Desulfovibrio sp.]
MKLFIAVFWVWFLCAGQALAATAPVDDVRKANIFLTDFEKEVARADGAETRFFNKRETLERVQRLAKQYPDDPAVQDLVRRTKAALMRSKGDFHRNHAGNGGLQEKRSRHAGAPQADEPGGLGKTPCCRGPADRHLSHARAGTGQS